jgi:hypothetical protein
MDTREKIVALEIAFAQLEHGDWIVVPGLFDPLTSLQARRIAELRSGGRRLLAIVLDSQGALLSAEARATLIAGLRDVDAVTIGPATWRDRIRAGPSTEVVNDLEAEEERSAQFVQFVLDRQNTAPCVEKS